ncbi:hypothetical protein ESY86_13505 [Subsaximicrobium wynnwilliamsii]|uniref:Uncharacterized protein n=1 Tax=Subsaximicrobium wynnwilliamsii TaxID=291179 RepID=A0A5C6ZE58_9FLAO|nr:hypothetical protein [Subsaximicrobium wynnwilliamsii]TXD83202.1 hypothetical protein ESY87_10900 [Subsaximicrobium wynnwilliamsii]TXD88314.1 hypothetical protein ESY86_13505 [Subsaximicrobium wynnwilliamsii]TXE03035.1 hypothetical protein ESY88_09920 [Subsaximicrobium wynnwilliamsii]
MSIHIVNIFVLMCIHKLKVNQPFLILEVQALFEIKKNDFEDKVKQDDGSYLVAKGPAFHFALLAVGSARGILHTKTEGTAYSGYLLPTIDVKQLVEQDVVFRH